MPWTRKFACRCCEVAELRRLKTLSSTDIILLVWDKFVDEKEEEEEEEEEGSEFDISSSTTATKFELE